MTTRIYGSSLSIPDYLQAKSFEQALTSEIRKQTRLIVASNKELQSKNITVVETASEDYEQIVYALENLSDSVDEIKATFQWGFNELLAETGRINDTLSVLLAKVTTPGQTWAYEQYEIARDAFRQELYQDAIECLDRAINGYAGNTGYKLEYRFHFLLGTIHLGRFSTACPEVIDYAKAKLAFLDAARYATRDEPKYAARALMAAGWADACEDRTSDAIEHTMNAIRLDASLAEAYFQMAKIKMHSNLPVDAIPFLKRAIELDRDYALKALGEPNFRRYEEQVEELLNNLRSDAHDRAEKAVSNIKQLVTKLGEVEVEGRPIAEYADSSTLTRAIEDVDESMERNTYHGYLEVINSETHIKSLIDELTSGYRVKLKETLSSETKRIEGAIYQYDCQINAAKNLGIFDRRWGWLALVGALACFLIGIIQGCGAYKENTAQEALRNAAIARNTRVVEQMKENGIKLDGLTKERVENLGYKLEILPPLRSGMGFSAFEVWRNWVFGGTVLCFLIAVIVNNAEKSSLVDKLGKSRWKLKQELALIEKIRISGT